MKKIFLFFISITLLYSCASVKSSKVYDQKTIDSIKTWSIEFMYEPSEISKTESDDTGKETTVKKLGNYPLLLGFKDDLFYFIKDNYSLNIKKDDEKAEGKILINPVNFNSYQVLDVDILIVSAADIDDGLARIQVEVIGGGGGMLETCATAIASTLNLQ